MNPTVSILRPRAANPATNPPIDEIVRASLAVKRAQALELLHGALEEHGAVTFANSFGAEDMVLTDLILREALPITVFSLDTGRLPAETYALMGEVERHYATRLEVYFPDTAAVEHYVRTEGINAFYDAIELRKRCCAIRKVEPLRRALAGKGAWVTGMRAAQSATRAALPVRQFDEANGLEKYNPLADWSEQDVWAYIRLHGVPYNVLHDQFYPSIGCAPCTRAITVGEDVRAGRWWWEDPDGKECGLHRK
ncbi:MAG: phosphoadenylyl-sulfate reductase [Candidatus Dactylopiibacterium sp.]|nr:phosphoadenylyl-sulfate reductase [Candidatus Dactylopiibacterium sp.]